MRWRNTRSDRSCRRSRIRRAAAARFEKAVSLNPNFAEALIALAKTRSDAKKYAEAIPLLERAVKLQPASESAHYSLMLAYRNAGRIDDAQREKAVFDKLSRPPEGEFTEFLKKLGEKAPNSEDGAAAVSVLLFFAGATYRVGLPQRRGRRRPHRAVFRTAATRRKQFILETTGSGAAFIDYDNDGLLDIFLVSGDGGMNRLYHNEGNGHFTDVTAKMGLGGRPAGARASARATTTTTASPTCSSPTGARITSTATSADADSKTSRNAPASSRTASATTPAAPFSTTTTTAHADLFVANYLKFDPADHAQARRESVLLVSRAARGMRAARPSLRSQHSVPQQRRRHLHRRLRMHPVSPSPIRTTRSAC